MVRQEQAETESAGAGKVTRMTENELWIGVGTEWHAAQEQSLLPVKTQINARKNYNYKKLHDTCRGITV